MVLLKMEIKIQNSAELNRLMDALAQEIVDANICHRLYSDLLTSIEDNEEVFRESNTFWNFTFLNSFCKSCLLNPLYLDICLIKFRTSDFFV